MTLLWVAVLLAVSPAVVTGQANPPTVPIRPGMVITQSTRLTPGTYRFAAPASLDSALIVIRGDDVTVDFQGATLAGIAPDADPDGAQGVAVRVDSGRNVRILNARIRGYKVGILARGTTNLGLQGNDLSYNWKPRLYSLVEHESLVDWLSFHHNEQGEWLRFGAAIYLVDVKGGDVRDNRAVQGMNGLLLVRSDGLRVQNNELAFNSGLGIGLYRASHDTIIGNRLDWNVRGYSHRRYSRGQDSADLLLYEQSSNNVVAYNSMTHGGDGVFLWAGQSTMDSGAGGANDNLFYGNDVSYATANGIEATFSRNTFIANRAWGNEYGLWGGYSFSSVVVGNDFSRNRTGVAIEHGQDNVIVANRFARDSTGIRLWGDSLEPSDWGYPKHHDTESRDYRISDNLFLANRVAVRAARTRGITFTGNRWRAVDSALVLRDTSGFTGQVTSPPGDTLSPALPAEFARLAPVPAGTYPSSALTRRDRSAIVVDEWGPFDWQSPKLWPVDSTRAVPLGLAVLGPPGRWRVITRRGIARLSLRMGKVGDTIAVTPAADSTGDWRLALEYDGAAMVTPRGERRAAGRPYRFSYERFEPTIDWAVRFFSWSDTAAIRERGVTGGTALFERHASRLDYEWYRPPIPDLPRERWALQATGTVQLAPGDYTLRTISDDGVRVWVDGALAIDAWTPHESAVDVVRLPGGRHDLRVEYYQADGWTELRVEIVRGYFLK